MIKDMKKLGKLIECPYLSKMDIRLYLYLRVYCETSLFIPPFSHVAQHMLTNGTAIRESYARLIKRGFIEEVETIKIANSYGRYFKFL